MTAPQIQELISEQRDGFEIVRDKIADVLKVESAQQQALAAAARKDPNSWALRVFTEAQNPWELYRDPPLPSEPFDPCDYQPIVNVWFEKTLFDEGSSDAIKRQTGIGTFNCDCYGYGFARPAGPAETAAVQTLGDVEAVFESQRAARLVRRILMSSYYVNLGLLKLVGSRFPISIETFPVPQGAKQASNVAATRLALKVQFNEYSPQYLAQLLEQIVFSALRDENGELLYSVTLNFPSP